MSPGTFAKAVAKRPQDAPWQRVGSTHLPAFNLKWSISHSQLCWAASSGVSWPEQGSYLPRLPELPQSIHTTLGDSSELPLQEGQASSPTFRRQPPATQTFLSRIFVQR